MRRGLAAIAATAVTAVMVTGTSGGSARPLASLRLVRTEPFVVRGVGFKAREHARLTLTVANDQTVRRVIARAAGGFVVSFGVVPLSRCDGYLVVAVGNRGSRAALKRPPLPECLPE
jgi:hypothetical protein